MGILISFASEGTYRHLQASLCALICGVSWGVVRHLPACASHGRRVGLAVRGGGRIKWKEGSMSVMKFNEIRR